MLLIQVKQVASIIGQLARFHAEENVNINVTTFYDQSAIIYGRLTVFFGRKENNNNKLKLNFFSHKNLYFFKIFFHFFLFSPLSIKYG